MASVEPSVNGLALFACAGADLFEAMPLAAPIDRHRLYVADRPHLYPLARVLDEYPRYAVLLADTHSARILVIAANRLERTASVEGMKTRRHKMGGWSQARYQRHIDNFRQQHAKQEALFDSYACGRARNGRRRRNAEGARAGTGRRAAVVGGARAFLRFRSSQKERTS